MRTITRSVLIAPVLIALMASSFVLAQSTSFSNDTNQTTGDKRHQTGNTAKEVQPNTAAGPRYGNSSSRSPCRPNLICHASVRVSREENC
jgi:hypothetical protein